MNQTEKPTRAANVTLYESDRRALSTAVKVDEIKDVFDRSSASLVEYARRPRTQMLIVRATELRLTCCKTNFAWARTRQEPATQIAASVSF